MQALHSKRAKRFLRTMPLPLVPHASTTTLGARAAGGSSPFCSRHSSCSVPSPVFGSTPHHLFLRHSIVVILRYRLREPCSNGYR